MKDGGPAFPWVSDKANTLAKGMTLLDYFAGQAILGILSNPDCKVLKGADEFASAAYNVAASMIKAREQ